MNKNLAAIDIGSNTVQLLINKYSNRILVSQESYLRTTRLGNTGANGDLSAEAIDATIAALQEFCHIAQKNRVSQMRILATSAVRDAGNSDILVQKAKGVTSVPLEIISGETEAQISYLGAKSTLDFSAGVPVIDSGGSSTEIICEDIPGDIAVQSINIGAVRAYKKHWHKQEIYSLLAEKILPIRPQSTLIGVGGTITTIAGVIFGMQEYCRDGVHGKKLAAEDIRNLYNSLLPLDISQRCQYSPLLQKRGEIIKEGLDIWLSLLDIFQAKKITVCGGGILDGAIAGML